ncbi:MAG: hypothetical protein IPG09_18440 [Ignavibacteria bacterium]|nr:hypothetical protein [Ignavibacteria bacterium]
MTYLESDLSEKFAVGFPIASTDSEMYIYSTVLIPCCTAYASIKAVLIFSRVWFECKNNNHISPLTSPLMMAAGTWYNNVSRSLPALLYPTLLSTANLMNVNSFQP